MTDPTAPAVVSPLILALDTSSRRGSVALSRGRDLIAAMEGDLGRSHGERLPGDVLDLVRSHGTTLQEIDLFAVAAGPGSFTGLRVGIATIQGFALANGRRVVAVSALDATVHLGIAITPAIAPGDLIGSWIDAQRQEIFTALYERSAEPSGAVAVEPPSVGQPGTTLDRWLRTAAGRRLWLLGDGVAAHRPTIAGGAQLEILEPGQPLAPTIALLALEGAARGEAIAPHGVRPVYIRRPDAELARERAADRVS